MLLWSRQRLCALTVPPTPSINGAPIEQVTSAKSQRVIINDKFTWRNHINELTKNIASGIVTLQTNQASCPLRDLTFCLHSGRSTTVFQLLQCCFGKLRGNFAGTLKLQKLQNIL